MNNLVGAYAAGINRVLRDKLAAVKLRNAAGKFVTPSEAGFRAAILESDMHRQGDDQATLLDRPGADTWPITLTSFVLVDAEPATAAQACGQTLPATGRRKSGSSTGPQVVGWMSDKSGFLRAPSS